METKRNTLLLTITLVLVAVLVVISIVNLTTGRTLSASNVGATNADNIVAVYGQGKIAIEPDVAYITFGVENIDNDPKKAQDDNTAKMDNVLQAIKNAGIEDADIQTVQYSVNQESNYNNNDKQDGGYRVYNAVQVKLSDIHKAGDIIKVAYDAGANRFVGIRFDVIERRQAYLDALDLATQRALEKAEKLAKDAGRKIAGVVEIQESSTSAYSSYSSLSNFVTAEVVADASDYDGGAVSSGQIQIIATVNVIYRLN